MPHEIINYFTELNCNVFRNVVIKCTYFNVVSDPSILIANEPAERRREAGEAAAL